MIVPETVTGTILPFGGHKTLGVAERVITGGVVSAVLLSSTATVPGPPKIEKSAFATTASGIPSPFRSAPN